MQKSLKNVLSTHAHEKIEPNLTEKHLLRVHYDAVHERLGVVRVDVYNNYVQLPM